MVEFKKKKETFADTTKRKLSKLSSKVKCNIFLLLVIVRILIRS